MRYAGTLKHCLASIYGYSDANQIVLVKDMHLLASARRLDDLTMNLRTASLSLALLMALLVMALPLLCHSRFETGVTQASETTTLSFHMR